MVLFTLVLLITPRQANNRPTSKNIICITIKFKSMAWIISMHTHDLKIYLCLKSKAYIYDSLNELLQPTAKMLQTESYHWRLFFHCCCHEVYIPIIVFQAAVFQNGQCVALSLGDCGKERVNV